jgi:hypothetical protein
MLPTSLLQHRILHASRAGSVRGFTSSRIHHIGAIELTAELFRSVHDVSGLSYGLTIPLTALALRTAITLPLAIYSQKKLNRRLEFRPLFFHWGEIIGMQTAKLALSGNADLRNDKDAMKEVLMKMQMTVTPNLHCNGSFPSE